ncbi:MAG: hypothetical protein HY040_11020 [Planctomycetes bacterium]|nr:hypothetical protein [Planctomycetota bacterium]
MKAISVRQPWTYTIVVGEKTIENKSKPTKHRGLLAVHAGKQANVLNAFLKASNGDSIDRSTFALGYVVGVVELVDVVELNRDLEKNPWAYGPYCWILAEPRVLEEPIPAKGQLGVFQLSESESTCVQQQISRAKKVSAPDALLQAIERNESDPWEKIYFRVCSYAKLERADDIIRLCNEGLSLHPESALFFGHRGHGYFLKEQYNDALSDLNKAIDLDPLLGPAYQFRGYAYERLGYDAKAKADLEIAEKLAAESDQDEGED